MRWMQYVRALLFTISPTLLFLSPANAVDLRFTWMLPKTVLDANVTYTFEDCSNNNLKLKITPTLTPRTIADPLVGKVKIQPLPLESFWNDANISLQTFPNSQILNSIGSNPTSQVGQITGNIVGGIAKLVGAVLGLPGAAADRVKGTAPAPIIPQCATDSGSAQAIATQIKGLKTKVQTMQAELANAPDDATQKKDSAAITVAQALIATLQSQITITINTTIDPGISPVDVNPDDSAASQNPITQSAVGSDGLIARFCPSETQLAPTDGAKWFSNPDQIFKDAGPHCAAIPAFEVNVYLDFPSGKGTMFDVDGVPFKHGGAFPQTVLASGDLYRDVAYLPVLVWRGSRDAPKGASVGPPSGPVQLAPPLTEPFGQFGVAQTLPLTVAPFKGLTWQITFLENGQISAASFSTKATGVNATTLFGTAATDASSIASAQRTATSSSSDATILQSQADLIYERQRLTLCQGNPVACPSK